MEGCRRYVSKGGQGTELFDYLMFLTTLIIIIIIIIVAIIVEAIDIHYISLRCAT